MTDRELLEFAAKAAGIDDSVLAYDNDGTAGTWNPLTDDGDALRLAIKLNMTIRVCGQLNKDTWVDCKNGAESIVNHANNPYSATRRAIVETAAYIGKYQND